MNNKIVIFKYPSNVESSIYTHIIINENVRMHKHDFFECLYVLEGEALHIVNDKESIVKSNYFHFLNSNDYHSLKGLSTNFYHRDILLRKSSFEKVCSMYSNNLFNKIEKGEIKLNGYLSYSELETIDRYCHRLDLNPSKEEQDEIFMIIASTLINLMLRSNKDEQNGPEWIYELIAILNTKENFHLPLNSLLKKFDYSHEHIMRVFKKHTGNTLVQYFNDKKLEEAYRLLANTNLSINEIIDNVGFSNDVHFYHIFKKKFKKTPRQVRN